MINTKTLRCWLGVLGMSLPWIVLFQSLVFGYPFPQSISATYFNDTCIVPFMIILGSAGVLLCNYHGYTNLDNWLNTAAGLCAFGVCLFPCAAQDGRLGTFLIAAPVSDILHMIFAISFFGILAYNSLFQFTKGSDNPTPEKKKRNIIYRVCGIGMIASFVLLPIFSLLGVPYATWIIEAIALTFLAFLG